MADSELYALFIFYGISKVNVDAQTWTSFYQIDFVSDPQWDSTWNNSIPRDCSTWEHSALHFASNTQSSNVFQVFT